MSDTDPLVANSTGESGYRSVDKSTQQYDDNRSVTMNQNTGKRLRHSKLCLGCTIVLTIILALLLPVSIGCTAHFHSKDAACYNTIPQMGVYTRSDAYSILYSTSAITCFEKPIRIEVALHNEAASVDIYKTQCESIETRSFGTGWSNTVNISVGQPAPIFSDDFSSQNYFISGTIQVDMIDITTSSSSVGIELCLFTNNDDFQAFVTAGTDWKNFIKNAKCHSAQIKTGDNNSTTFSISEPTFAFVGIAATGNLSIGNLTVTADGFELFGTGENSTKVCQLNGKHPTCNFSLINNDRKEVCLIAHEAQQAPGDAYDYSNLIIKFSTETNVRFWICLSVLLVHIATCVTMTLCIVLIRVICIYKKWKQDQLIIPAQNADDHSTPTMSASAINMATSDTETSSEVLTVPIPETHEPPTPAGYPLHGTQTSAEQANSR